MDRAIGIDISVWDDDISTPQHVNFAKAIANGASFVYIKSSQQGVDRDFLMNWENAKAAGILRGAYHFLDWRLPTINQAQLFVSLLVHDPGELPPMLDLEMSPGPYNVNPVMVRTQAAIFLSYVEKTLGKVPGLYCGYFNWIAWGDQSSAWTHYPLWLPWYANESIVKTPPPWPHWTFWQNTDRADGLAYGCESKGVDTSFFNGTKSDLYKWAGISPTGQSTPRICPTCGQPWPTKG